MNEELRARAIEAAARADFRTMVDEHNKLGARTWERASDVERDNWRAQVTPSVDATLSVVADWCDQRRVPRPSEMGDGWNAALDELAGTCRPVGEET